MTIIKYLFFSNHQPNFEPPQKINTFKSSKSIQKMTGENLSRSSNIEKLIMLV